ETRKRSFFIRFLSLVKWEAPFSYHRTGAKRKNGIVLLLCSFEKVAAPSRSQNMTAKRLAHLLLTADKRSEHAREEAPRLASETMKLEFSVAAPVSVLLCRRIRLGR